MLDLSIDRSPDSGIWKGTGYVSVTVPGGATVSDSFELNKFHAPRVLVFGWPRARRYWQTIHFPSS